MNQKFYKDANEVYANNRMCLVCTPMSDDLIEDYIIPDDPELEPTPVFVTDPIKVAKAFYDGQLTIVAYELYGQYFMKPTSISLVPDGSTASPTGTALVCHCEFATQTVQDGLASSERELYIAHNVSDTMAFEVMRLAGVPTSLLMPEG